MSLGRGYRRKKQEEFKNLFLLRCTKVLLKDCSLYFLLDKYLFEVNTFRTTYVDMLTLELLLFSVRKVAVDKLWTMVGEEQEINMGQSPSTC